MSQQRPGAVPQSGSSRWSDGARIVLAVCLLALVGAGLRAAVPAPVLDGPFRQHGVVFGGVAEAVLACLLVVLVVRQVRAPRAAVLAARLRRLLLWVVVISFVVIGVAYLPLHSPKLAPRPQTQRPAVRPTPGVLPHQAASRLPAALVIVVAILVALWFAAVAYVIVRYVRAHRGRWRGRSRVGGVPAEGAAGGEEPALREAVESGHSALRLLDDARAAIIACYLAMEQSLARAGAERAVADTPDELLARAARRGLVRGDAAARLTAAFYEARFSSHPVPRERRDDAEQALRELAASLGDAVPADAGAVAGGTGGTGGTAGTGGTGGAAGAGDRGREGW